EISGKKAIGRAVSEEDRRERRRREKESADRAVERTTLEFVVEALVPSAYLFSSALDTSTATTLFVMNARRLCWIAFVSFTVSLLAEDKVAEQLKPALDVITPDALLSHIKILASDEFEGRAPGSKGEELSIKYIAEQFKAAGLAPGNPDGSYFQEVPLAGIKSDPKMQFAVSGKPPMDLKFADDFVASSARLQNEIKINNSDVVFVGYGIVAPEYGWDDYKGVDVKGKTILMLVNDPQIKVAGDTTLDSTMFKGKAMTYYGRWTYKYEIASEKGAAAAIIIHETGPAGYPFGVVKGSNSQEQFDVVSPDAEKRVPVEGWITLEKATEILTAAGKNFDSLKAAATKKDFKPVAINAKATYHVK